MPRLSEIDAGMLAEVGGKAAQLGELTRAGLPVPPGWALTTEAYRRVAEAAGLAEVIAGGGGAAGLAGAARTRLLETPVPAEVAGAVVAAYEELGGGPVAVRSSATAEDLPFASFAGQQDTYLNVVGADAVLDAVRRCWASLWTDRAVAYREANGIDHAGVRIAVVVQVMVDARVAGVMFTANPLTGRRHEAVIDASPGLGEAVVSGAVNPDRFVVDTATGRVLDRHEGDKRLAVRAVPGGGTRREEHVPAGLCLTDAQARDLAGLGARVERHYGAPQDIEWAIDDDGRLWLTQARPVTTLFPLPETTREGLRVYFSVNVAQGVMRPLTPMGLAAIKLTAAGAARLFGYGPAVPGDGPAFMAESGGRLWLDLTTALRSRAGRMILPRMLRLGEARAAVVVDRLMTDPRLSVIHTTRRPVVRAAARFARRIHLPARVLRALAGPRGSHAYVRGLGERIDRRLRVPAGATPAQRLDHAERVLAGTFPLVVSVMPLVITGYGLFALAARLSGVPLGEMQDVLRSLPANPTTEMDLELWALAGRIEPEPFRELPVHELARRYRDGALPSKAQREIAGFLGRYGHRGVAEIDLGLPRWSEDPAHILGVLANYLRTGVADGPAPDELFDRGAADAEAAVAAVVARARRGGRLRGAVTRFALRRTRAYGGLREMPKFLLVQTLAGVRRSMLAVGEHLAAAGVLADADDVFFLTFAEARAALPACDPGRDGYGTGGEWGGDLGRNVYGTGGELGGDLRELVAGRRAAYEREARRRHVPRVVLSDGTEPEAQAAATAEPGSLRGSAASAGTVTGPARVVLDPVGAHLEPGEILVCPSTDPGWTPLFLTAGGLVMEMGGAMSHGAVVAREYGIPAVVGVADATRRITTGARITVDGAAGTVALQEA